MRTTASAAYTSTSSIAKQFQRVLLLSALFVTASLNSWAQNITVSPASLAFAKQIVGTTSSFKALTITNSGASAQAVNIVMSGDFTETDNCGGSISGGGSCTGKISFAPTLTGAISGAASIYDNSENLLAFVGLTGTGAAPVTTAPASLSFGAVPIGTLSAAKTFKITNNTANSISVTAIMASSDYVINTGTCLTTAIASKKYCTVSVQVQPTSPTDDGAIIITDNAPSGLPLAVGLSATGTGGPTTPISLSKTSLTFKTAAGGTSAAQTITVTNTSASAVTMGTISASSDYAIVSNTCPASLSASGTCTFGITFNPVFVGKILGAAAVAYTGNDSPQLVNLTGTSLAPLTVAPAKLAFAAQAVGTTSTAKPVKITNDSTSAVTLSSVVPSGDFQIQLSGTTCALTGGTLAAGKNCTIQIQFAPTIAGSIVGSLTVTNTASPNPLLVPLAGTGTATYYTIGGTVSGLSGTGLVLQNNGGNNLAITANGSFTFTTPVASGGTYNVTVLTQPSSPAQTCVVTNGSGTATANVTNVQVACTTITYTIGGTVSGLSGTGLVLQDNGGNNLAITANGSFTFTTPVASGSTYNVTVLTEPSNPAQTCLLTNGYGTANANVTNVQVACGAPGNYTIGGTVSGLSGTGLVLQNNGGNNLPISANGSFTFTTPVASGSTYNVTVLTEPSSPAQTCVLTNGSGTANANVTNVQVACTTPAATCTTAPAGHESMLNGQYAFVVQGFQGVGYPTYGPVAIAGSFHADGTGIVSGGELDINEGTAGAAHVVSYASSYTVGLDSTSSGNLGCVVLSLYNGSTAAFRFNLGGLNGSNVFSKGRIIEYDDATGAGTRVSGVLRLQDTTSFSLSQLQPRYTFGVDGVNSSGGHFASAGSFTVNTSGDISGGFEDMNDAGTIPGELTGGTGTINTISPATGWATMSLTFGGQTTHQAAYMVNADEFFLVGTDPLSSVPIYSGRVIVTASSFSESSLSGNYIIHATGIDPTCEWYLLQKPPSNTPCADVLLALVNLDSTSGSYSGTSYYYELSSSVFVPSTVSGETYTVDATSGRTTLSALGWVVGSAVFYIATPTASTEPISAFFVPTEDHRADFGFAEFQPSQTYSTSGMAGNYFVGTEDPSDNSVSNEIDVVNVSSGGTITGSGYNSSYGGLGTTSPSSTISAISIGSNGVGSGQYGGCQNTEYEAITNGTRIFFILIGGSYCNGINIALPAVVTVYELQ